VAGRAPEARIPASRQTDQPAPGGLLVNTACPEWVAIIHTRTRPGHIRNSRQRHTL